MLFSKGAPPILPQENPEAAAAPSRHTTLP
jgi:hypothetical protein